MDNNELRSRAKANPDVAIDETGKIVKRWERGGDSHWILYTPKNIDGKQYELIDIRVTAGVNYLICRAK